MTSSRQDEREREREGEGESDSGGSQSGGTERRQEGVRVAWKDGDRNSNSLLPPVKYNSRAHSRLDNPRSLCMKTYYGGR